MEYANWSNLVHSVAGSHPLLVFAATDEIPNGRFSGVGLLGFDYSKRVFADPSRILEPMVSRRGHVALAFARNPISVLAALLRLDRVVIVSGCLLAIVCRDGSIIASFLVHSIAICSRDGLGWLRTHTCLFRDRLRSVHACT